MRCSFEFLDIEAIKETSATSTVYTGILTTLLDWHELDPPDLAEQERNDLIYEDYQNNRNPFIDHPELVDQLYVILEPSTLAFLGVQIGAAMVLVVRRKRGSRGTAPSICGQDIAT